MTDRIGDSPADHQPAPLKALVEDGLEFLLHLTRPLTSRLHCRRTTDSSSPVLLMLARPITGLFHCSSVPTRVLDTVSRFHRPTPLQDDSGAAEDKRLLLARPISGRLHCRP